MSDPLSIQALQLLPKVELHLHLDCSLGFEAARRLHSGLDRASFQRDFVGPERCGNLAEFLKTIDASLALLQTQEGLRIAVEDLFLQLQDDHVIYAEIRFAPHLHRRQGLPLELIVETVADSVREASARRGIEARIILCTLRHFTKEEGLETARLVHLFRDSGVVALDLAADEAGFPLENHIPAFRWAREHGLGITAHAGEARGPESVRETLTELKVRRLGHGVRSIEDRGLVEELILQGIHLEICPSCNVKIGVFESYATHPIDRLFLAGISLSVNTDGRTLTGITLAEEYARLQKTFGWGQSQFLDCTRNALKAAFLDEGTRERLLNRLEQKTDPIQA